MYVYENPLEKLKNLRCKSVNETIEHVTWEHWRLVNGVEKNVPKSCKYGKAEN